ncbi:hypothetical protein KC349_g301 [Hortaea werneckii]|nr:hypothetical protein KC349_g301 [Hortaea werneckii]
MPYAIQKSRLLKDRIAGVDIVEVDFNQGRAMPAYDGLDFRQSPRFVVGYRHVGVVVYQSGTRPGQSFAPEACNVDVAVSSATHRLQKAGGSESALVEVLLE